MKRILKVFLITIVFICAFHTLNIAYSNKEQLSVQINQKQEETQYKQREINLGLIKLIYQDEIFFNGENNKITEKQKNTNNIIIAVFAGALVLYWLILLFKYEREEMHDYIYENSDDIKMLKKYNPMLAGCLVDNRQVLARDVTAVVLNLIQKQVINMEMIPNMKGKEQYTYIISENKNISVELDEIERYVLKWIFGFYEQNEVDLLKKLKELSKRKDFIKNMKKLNNIAQSELNKIGANIPKTPPFIRKLNFGLIGLSIMMAIVHIINNGLNIQIYQTTMLLMMLIVIAVVLVIPIVALTIHLILFSIVIFKKIIKDTTEKNSGKKIVTISTLILATMSLLILLIWSVVPDKYICLDVFLIGMSILIVKTDNLMTKHNKEILNDYYCLQEIKYKIEEYSLIKDEQINYIKLWEEYLIYAVAFGIPIPIVNKLRESHKEDEDIKYLLKCENLYYICKAYLEVMWDMNFKERKSKFSIKELFEI